MEPPFGSCGPGTAASASNSRWGLSGQNAFGGPDLSARRPAGYPRRQRSPRTKSHQTGRDRHWRDHCRDPLGAVAERVCPTETEAPHDFRLRAVARAPDYSPSRRPARYSCHEKRRHRVSRHDGEHATSRELHDQHDARAFHLCRGNRSPTPGTNLPKKSRCFAKVSANGLAKATNRDNTRQQHFDDIRRQADLAA
ncbi:hypothetical protein GGQ85_002428 [Nitrobacter vulgaris]|nr:hypothetical protein [Nitrobacter vulgaris]